MADIWVDSSASGANDGTSPADAFTSIASVASISAGDRVWVRRTHAESITSSWALALASVANNPPAIVGWPISGDTLYASRPAAGTSAGWDSDSTSAIPTITINTSGVSVNLDISGLLHERTKYVSGASCDRWLLRTDETAVLVRKCVLDQTVGGSVFFHSGTVQVPTDTDEVVVFESCTFKSNGSLSSIAGNCGAVLVDCDVDGGGSVMNLGTSGSGVLYGCRIGATTPPGAVTSGASFTRVSLIGCDLNGTPLGGPNTARWRSGGVRSLHHDGALDAYLAEFSMHTVEKVASPARSGGGAYSLVVTPKSSTVNTQLRRHWSTSPFAAMSLPPASSHLVDPEDSWSVYADSGSITLEVYVYTRNWTTLPTADELFLTAAYIANATTGAMALAKSTEAVSANATWTKLSVTINPAAAGLVYLSLGLNIYESGSPTRDVLVDPLPVAA